MNWLRNFMMGRYGADQLSFALVIFYFVLSLVGQICRIWWFSILLLPLLVFLFWRMFSRNYEARRRENDRFLKFWNPIKKKFRSWKSRLSDRTHKYYHCPACAASLRVPKGRGKISIRCPRCGKEFIKKT